MAAPPRIHRGQRRFDAATPLYPYLANLLNDATPLIKANIDRKKGVHLQNIPQDIIGWSEQRFYIPATAKPIVWMPHQVGVLRLAFTRLPNGDLPYNVLIYSTIKQSGKSTVSGVALRWYAETQARFSELYAIGNDQDQAKKRGFREARTSIELTPGFDNSRGRLAGEWDVLETIMRCKRTRSSISALAVDARGEAGGKPAIQVWTELWGFEQEAALRFWDELTPIPTIPDSMRIVETYAGYEQESTLLKGIYDGALAGRQLTAGELATRTGVPNDAFAECGDDPDALIPVWENTVSKTLMYWDSGLKARRMPWQQGERGDAYYRQQETTLLPQAYRRLHGNEWVSAESSFIPEALWDACQEDLPKLEPGDRTPVVMAVDAATTGDCFAILLVSRHPERHDAVAVRRVVVYDPREVGVVDYDEAEKDIRRICGGYCNSRFRHPKSQPEEKCEACAAGDRTPGFNVVQIAYDPYQLEQMMQRLRKDSVAWCEAFSQAQERLVADRSLYDLIINRGVVHDGDQRLRSHILAAGAKVQKDQDSTLRLVKVSQTRKIDAAVALSMASARCLYLRL